MDLDIIKAVSDYEFGKSPIAIVRKEIGICNDVFELVFDDHSLIIRMNVVKEWLYGTEKFLPIFNDLDIPVPKILASDYSKKRFSICYQIQSKIEGQDLKEVFNDLNEEEIRSLAVDISRIMDKFKSLNPPINFGVKTGLNEEQFPSLWEMFQKRRNDTIQRNAKTGVIDKELLDLYKGLIEEYRSYFETIRPALYYDDMSSKNVMIHKGKFNGLVDLDFLMKGDYLELLGCIKAVWSTQALGRFYLNELIRLQNLNALQKEMVCVYSILTSISWMSEVGIQFNQNTSSRIDWEKVSQSKLKVIRLMGDLNKAKRLSI